MLYKIHEHLNAKFTIFAGYQLPLYYTSITQEHLAVRKNVGIFDVSHMGRILIQGNNSFDFLNYLTANDVEKIYPGKMQYSLILNEKGGIKDDITIFNMGNNEFLLVVNATNRLKIINWLNKHKHNFGDIRLSDLTKQSIMIAVQGPKSKHIIDETFNNFSDLRRFHFGVENIETSRLVISRSGYTGEDGFEIILLNTPRKRGIELWNKLFKKVIEINGLPCGLGARDSLRIEAGYCLYDNDIDENTNPYEASLGWVVKIYKKDFIGKKALLELKNKVLKMRMGLVMKEPGIPRKGYKIYHLDKDSHEKTIIGYVTSGTYSPILNKGIGMGYISSNYIDNKEIYIEIRKKLRSAEIKSFPLYDENQYGWKRVNK